MRHIISKQICSAAIQREITIYRRFESTDSRFIQRDILIDITCSIKDFRFADRSRIIDSKMYLWHDRDRDLFAIYTTRNRIDGNAIVRMFCFACNIHIRIEYRRGDGITIHIHPSERKICLFV